MAKQRYDNKNTCNQYSFVVGVVNQAPGKAVINQFGQHITEIESKVEESNSS